MSPAWPFIDSTDLDRCISSFSSSAPTANAVALLERALEPFRSVSARPPIPWPSWALRLPALFGAAVSAELFAAAIALIMSAESAPPPLAVELRGLALTLLEQLGAKRESVALLLMESQLVAPPASRLPGALALEADGTPQKLALLFGLAALIAKVDPQPWLRFAAALAEPIALLISLVDLVDDTPFAELLPLRLEALLRACEPDAAALAALLDGCAGGFVYAERLEELRAAVGHEAILRQLRAQREAILQAARAAVPELGAQPGIDFLDALTTSFAALDSELWTHALIARALCGPKDVAEQAAVGLAAAIAYLEETYPWRSAWDVHRFHPMGAPSVLYGRDFIEGLILLSLSEMNGGQQPERRAEMDAKMGAILDRVPAGDARYFPDFTGLPPDVDSLGLLLQLATRLDAPPRAKLDGWIAVLDSSLDETRVVPVWLERGPNGRTASLDGPFLGNDCTAVRLAFLLGALRYDARRFEPLMRPNLLATIARYDGGVGFTDCVHYEPSFAVYMFLRLLQALCTSEQSFVQALCRELALPRILTGCADAVIAMQRIDGGWGSPQRTALALESLAPIGIPRERLLRGLKYLGDTQNPDGAWSAEPLYITPGKHSGMVPLATKEVTTALCARALHAVLSASLVRQQIGAKNEERTAK